MRAWITAPVAVALAVPAGWAAGPASADTGQPPFVDHVAWVQWDGRPSLRVYPTPGGRAAAGAAGDDAWREVLALAPEADTPGVREQFLCHWQFAELGRPGKISWNLEPWRPVVDGVTMLATGCNPGGAEEPF